jgi:hypothetical protein
VVDRLETAAIVLTRGDLWRVRVWGMTFVACLAVCGVTAIGAVANVSMRWLIPFVVALNAAIVTWLSYRWRASIGEGGILLQRLRSRHFSWTEIERIGWARANGPTDPTYRPWFGLASSLGVSNFRTYPAVAFEVQGRLVVLDQTAGATSSERARLVEALQGIAASRAIPCDVSVDDLKPAPNVFRGSPGSDDPRDLASWNAERRRRQTSPRTGLAT